MVVIRQCTATTGTHVESCEGSSTMERLAQLQSYVNQTELTSELNLQRNYFVLVVRKQLTRRKLLT